jgi:hypothetical protein
MSELTLLLERSVVPIAAAALVVAVVALLVAIAALRRAGRRPEVAGEDAAPTGDAALDRILSMQLQRLDALANEVTGIGGRTRALESDARQAVRRVGLVRFNPFEDTGSNQSFALALLNDEQDGIILSSLHSRQATRVYLKQIMGGTSEATLSAEETEALRQARSG